jgi:hypothetical protein
VDSKGLRERDINKKGRPMDPFLTGFICGIATCAFVWLCLTILAACMLARGKGVEEE